MSIDSTYAHLEMCGFICLYIQEEEVVVVVVVEEEEEEEEEEAVRLSSRQQTDIEA